MNKTAIIGTGLILGILGLVLPWLFFWAVYTLTGFEIRFGLETFGAFWILHFILRGNLKIQNGVKSKKRKKNG